MNTYQDDTICAISTPVGYGGIGIVRLSGKDSFSIIQKIFKMKNDKKVDKMATHTICFGFIVNENSKIVDEVLLTYMKAPKTYTREDIIEINCHSGPVVLKNILNICIENGARLAEPGEFTKRAFLNGRIDLIQAEAVSEIISSKSQAANKLALSQLRGETTRFIEKFRDGIIEILMNIQAAIEFPDDLEDEELNKFNIPDLNEIVQDLKNFIQNQQTSSKVIEGIKIIITGKSNTGKSTLLNKILKEEKSIVTDIPGTTRDTICGEIILNGILVEFIDTFGIKKPENKIEELSLEKLIGKIKETDTVIFLTDSSREMDEEDIKAFDLIKNKENIIFVSNKNDMRSEKFNLELIFNNTKNRVENEIKISALTGKGINSLLSEIENTNCKIDFSENLIGSNLRIVTGLKKCLDNLEKINIMSYNKINCNNFINLENIDEKNNNIISEDIIMYHLENAVKELDKIIGKEFYPEMLELIFNTFCIGK